MTKYKVLGYMAYDYEIEIEADTQEEAEEKAEGILSKDWQSSGNKEFIVCHGNSEPIEKPLTEVRAEDLPF